MDIQSQIQAYMAAQTEAKQSDMLQLHQLIQRLMPGCKLWFLDGKDEQGRIISNPNIGYGIQTIFYADGKTKEFYQVGISANTSGISVYILGIKDKKFLQNTYANKIGKAQVTGYCIKFKRLSEIRMDVLEAAIRDGIAQTAS